MSFCLVISIIYTYTVSWFSFADVADLCIEAKLNSYTKTDATGHNVIVKHKPLRIESLEKDFLQYVGTSDV